MVTQEKQYQNGNWYMSLRSRKFYIAVTIMKFKIYVSGHRTGALHKTIFKGTAEILAA